MTSASDPDGIEHGPGVRLGRYVLRYEIARGGMGTVYLAQLSGPSGFEKWVAIKWIHPHLAKDVRFVTMFLDEARLVAQLSHPNICQVHDLVAEHGSCWIVMEYLFGEPLSAVIGRANRIGGGLPPALAVRIVADAARGLHAAHEARGIDGTSLGIVHRDVSPHNVLVLHDGTVRLLDFGIAKVRGRLSSSDPGELKGKFPYMSPEQVRHRDLDRRSDVWALGVVLWEALTGRALFRAPNPAATVRRVIDGRVPPPSSLRVDAGIDEGLDRAVLAALDRDVDARTPTAASFADALDAYLHRLAAPTASSAVAAWMASHFADRRAKRDARLASVAGDGPSQVRDISADDDEGEDEDVASLADTPVPGSERSTPPPPPSFSLAPRDAAPSVPPERVVVEGPSEMDAPRDAFVEPPASSAPASSARGPDAEPPSATRHVRAILISAAIVGLACWLAYPHVARLPRLLPSSGVAVTHVRASDAGIATVTPPLTRVSARSVERRDHPPSPTVRRAVEVGRGFVEISGSPAGEVLVDGESWGLTPIHRHPLELGVHRIEVRWSEHVTRWYPVTVRDAETSVVHARMSDPETP